MSTQFTDEERRKLLEFQDAWDMAGYDAYLAELYEKYGIPKNGKGPVEDILKLPPDRQKGYAERFCEGSTALRDLLLELWAHGIETRGCCSGISDEHRYMTPQSPYFLITLTDGNREYVENFVGRIQQTSAYKTGQIYISRTDYKSPNDSISFHRKFSHSESDAFFREFKNALQDS